MTGFQPEQDAPVHGALVVNKPPGPTSHDIVQTVRRFFNTRVGHTGTLDPLASGVLVLLLGNATRLARFFQQSDKTYRAVIRLGVTTGTYDLEGEVESRNPVPDFSPREVERTLHGFTGEIEQMPPMFSAVRVGGERLYERARRGETVERKPRAVSIHCLELMELSGPDLVVQVQCSAGTYVRVLAHEIGKKLGCGACLGELCRLRSGDFRLSDAVRIDELSAPPATGFRGMDALLPTFPRIDLQADSARRARHGNPVRVPGTAGYCRLFQDNSLIAIARQGGGVAQPIVVFPHESD